ncbi:copper-binding protein [Denitratisoma oestradiolicum]|uniref:RND transporter n=1 Tax=Denitratisoma oestradiolicum TaxID=311182 RepID=A0A6S6YMA3_9PROT|nr:copper-binding protein [Denitratisoma oestradiolicum]TWO81960.1 RND transporter [Denitratisoma oestradiolicum]CAB1368864.1 RND transporter [Denitratisoma oestradiolicum]
MKSVLIVPVALTIFFSMPSIAADHDHGAMNMPGDAQLAAGVVKKVDKSTGKVTLTHGPLINLGMPGMTMAFRVKETGWLEQLKEGDNIRFMADKMNGVVTVVHFEPAR